MQNVLKQIGLNVIGVDGLIIRDISTFILRCHACARTTPDCTKVFCPSCGNKTLKRVSVSLDAETGSQQIHISARRRITPRGKRFTLPTPKSGKHVLNPCLVPDMSLRVDRPSKSALRKNTVTLDDGFVVGTSPFVDRDIYSKAALLGSTGSGVNKPNWMRRNPNQSQRKTRK